MLNRPLWVEFQKEQSTFAVDNQYMIGDKIIFYIFLSSLLRFLSQRVLYFCEVEPCWHVLSLTPGFKRSKSYFLVQER